MKLFYLTSEEHGLQALRNWRIKLSLFHDLNDPFELYAAALNDAKHRTQFRRFRDYVSENFGLICFSKQWKNPVLWSHYGDKHRGVALEVQVPPSHVCKVVYTPRRILLDVDAAMKRGSFSLEDAYRLATTKFQHWMYEDERRVFVPLSDRLIVREGNLHFHPFDANMFVSGMVLGSASTLTSETIAEHLQMGRSISVTRTRLAFNSFTIVRQKRQRVEFISGKR